MTVNEFREGFNILYDNIASKGAPGLDDYEISFFLTQAQEEIIDEFNKPTINKLLDKFETSDISRVTLKNLIVDYKSTFNITLNKKINNDSQFFKIPDNVFLIKHESANIIDPNCGSKTLDVIPKTLDEYNIQIKNPFKKPNNNKIWRLDYNSTEPGQNIVELISKFNIVSYNIRYLKKANPIILTDLQAGNFLGSNLTILGQTQQQTSELDSSIHSEILKRAVELATLSYKENTLGNRLKMDNK